MKVHKLTSEKHFPGLGPAWAVSPTPQCYCCPMTGDCHSLTISFQYLWQKCPSCPHWTGSPGAVTIRDNKNSVNWTDQIKLAVNSPGRRYSWFVMINVQFIILRRHIINLVIYTEQSSAWGAYSHVLLCETCSTPPSPPVLQTSCWSCKDKLRVQSLPRQLHTIARWPQIPEM